MRPRGPGVARGAAMSSGAWPCVAVAVHFRAATTVAVATLGFLVLHMQAAASTECDATGLLASERLGGEECDPRANLHALSVYPDDAGFLAPFHRDVRNFTFGGDTSVTIVQHWLSGGVSAVVWDAAIVLCDYIAGHPRLFAGRTVLELGAGTGMAGICAAKFGASVTLTDRKQALSTLEKNVNLNLGSTSATSAAASDVPPAATKVEELDWRDSASHPLLAVHWDVVLGADVVYRGGDPEALLSVLRALDAHVVYLSCRLRYDEDGEVVRQLGDFFVVELEHNDASKGVQLFVLKPLRQVSTGRVDL